MNDQIATREWRSMSHCMPDARAKHMFHVCRKLEAELNQLRDDVRPILHRFQSILNDHDELFEGISGRMEEFITQHPEFKF